MYKLLRVYYPGQAPGQLIRGAITHLDNGYGKPLCSLHGRNFKDSYTEKYWESELGKPTCDCCKLQLARAKENCGGGAA